MSITIPLDSIQYTLNTISGKWRMPLLHALFQMERARYSTLQQKIPKIGSKMLTTELKALEQLDLIERIITETPVITAYQLTSKGRSLLPVLEALAHWGEGKLPRKATELTHKNKHEINHFLTINI